MESLLPKEYEYRYRLSDNDGEFDTPIPFKSRHKQPSGLRMIAQDAARDYFNNGGWEATWPLEFLIYSGDELLGRFEIEMEPVPEFRARSVKPKPESPGQKGE